MPRAWRSFRDALAVAQAIGDARAASYAWGYLGHLYEDEGRYQEALDLTRRALFALQSVQAPEASYQWQWQSGRVLQALGQSEAAMDAYRQAVETLQAIRHEMGVAYGEPLRFRQTLGPVYTEFLDLLSATGSDRSRARRSASSARVLEGGGTAKPFSGRVYSRVAAARDLARRGVANGGGDLSGPAARPDRIARESAHGHRAVKAATICHTDRCGSYHRGSPGLSANSRKPHHAAISPACAKAL